MTYYNRAKDVMMCVFFGLAIASAIMLDHKNVAIGISITVILWIVLTSKREKE